MLRLAKGDAVPNSPRSGPIASLVKRFLGLRDRFFKGRPNGAPDLGTSSSIGKQYRSLVEAIRLSEELSKDLVPRTGNQESPAGSGRLDRALRALVVVPRNRRTLIVLVTLLLLCAFVPPIWQLKSGPISIVRWPKSGQVVIDVGPGVKSWTPINSVSRHVLYAIIVAEDGKFYSHAGIDLEEIVKSFQTNLEKGRYARGGSTITQQVVKMAFLSSEKSLLRKAREAVGAVLLEALLTKDEILAWYINMAEFGDGVFGLRKASSHYFQTKPELLTVQQGAHLALVLPSPNAWSKGLRNRSLTPFGHRRYATIISQLRAGGYITDALRDAALATGDFGRPIHGWIPGPDSGAEPELMDSEAEGTAPDPDGDRMRDPAPVDNAEPLPMIEPLPQPLESP